MSGYSTALTKLGELVIETSTFISSLFWILLSNPFYGRIYRRIPLEERTKQEVIVEELSGIASSLEFRYAVLCIQKRVTLSQMVRFIPRTCFDTRSVNRKDFGVVTEQLARDSRF